MHYAIVLPLLSILGLLGALANTVVGDYRGHRELLRISLIMMVLGWVVYTIPFLVLDYRLGEVARGASDGLGIPLRLAVSWSGGGSSLYFFSAIAAAVALYLMGRGAGAFFTVSVNLVLLISMVAAALNGAFDVVSVGGGAGLNPLLKSYWVIPHPLSTFGGYAILLVSSLAIYSGMKGRAVQALFLSGWSLLTLGITFGGMWSYETFGWGGYWAWDPVEVAELAVWLAATAVLHSTGPLSGFRKPMLLLLASSVPLGLYVTRSGLSPLHSFAAANVGALALLSLSIGFLGLMLYLVGASREVHSVASMVVSSFRERSLPGVAVSVAGSMLIVASIFVYSSLLTPSILTAVGVGASIPTMAEGARFYHPVLYPLILAAVAVMPGFFLASRLSWRGFYLYLAAVLLVGAAASYMAWAGISSPAPMAPASTRVMASLGLAVTSLSVALLLASLAGLSWRRVGPGRHIALGIVHVGVGLTLAGILLSGTYAFNDYYFETYRVAVGEEVEILPGTTLTIEDYWLEPGRGRIDLASHVAGKTSTSLLAWNALALLQEDLAPAIRDVKLAMEESRSNTSLRALKDLVLQGTLTLDRVEVSGRGRLALGDALTGVYDTMHEGSISIVVWGPNITIDLVPRVGGSGSIEGAWLGVSIYGESAVVEAVASNATAVGVHSYYVVELEEPYNLSLGDGTVVSISSLALYPGVEEDQALVEPAGRGLVLHKPHIVVASGLVYHGDTAFSAPGSYDRGVYMYIQVEKGEAAVLRDALGSSLAKYLADDEVLSRLSAPRPGDLPLPDSVLESVRLKLRLRVSLGDSERLLEPVIRFEANGEATGIHGLVTDTVIIRRGVDDIYISIQPPRVEGYFNTYHEPIIYYLSVAKKGLDPAEYLALVALMSAGYNMGGAGRLDSRAAALQVEQGIVDMYLLAERYRPEESSINTEGVIVQVKVVPGVNLLWAGAILMAMGGLLSALIHAKAHREASSTRAGTSTAVQPQ